jgi:hypothetical protein
LQDALTGNLMMSLVAAIQVLPKYPIMDLRTLEKLCKEIYGGTSQLPIDDLARAAKLVRQLEASLEEELSRKIASGPQFSELKAKTSGQ